MACLLFVSGFLRSSPAQPPVWLAQGASMVGILLGPPLMLQKPIIEKPSTILREFWRTQVYYTSGPREVNTLSSEPEHNVFKIYPYCRQYHFLLFMISKIPLYGLYYILFIHSSVEGHLGYFYCLAALNNVAINVCAQLFLWTNLFHSLGYISRNGITWS